MPQTFKALASILAWVLWISGMVMGFSTLILGIIRGHLFTNSLPPAGILSQYLAWFAGALGYAIGAVAVMKIRKSLE